MTSFQKVFDTLHGHFGLSCTDRRRAPLEALTKREGPPEHSVTQVPPSATRDSLALINSVKLTGDQLNRAFHVRWVEAEERLAALTAYAEREGIIPISHAAQALVIRMGLVADFLDGPGIANGDWNHTLEALARVRIVNDSDALPVGDSEICIDEEQFEELRDFAREMPW